MILEHKEDLPRFRAAIREWLADAVPAGWHQRMLGAPAKEYVELQRWWMAERGKVGLAVPHWPVAYGGADIGLRQQIIIADEMIRADAPSLEAFVISLNHIPATLFPFGTEEQKKIYLPGIARGDLWCQGFSEPDAGSDIASLRCRAEIDGDAYVVNGQKTWSSQSEFARYCILLVRTSNEARKQAGITFLILDLENPGVEVRPITQMNGKRRFGEIFLTDVRIPVENRVGAENDGWRVAQATLASERGVLSFDETERQAKGLGAFYREAINTGAAWLRDDQLRRELMTLLTEIQCVRKLIRELLERNSNEGTHGGGTDISPMFVKLVGTTTRRRIGEFMLRATGIDAQRHFDTGEMEVYSPSEEYLVSFGRIIAGGTNDIMRNLIAERGLGLPR